MQCVAKFSKNIQNSQPAIVMPWNFVMKTFKWYVPYSFGVDIPKMHVYISETVAGRNYDVIKNSG